MARVPLSRLSDWELIDPDQDLHGRQLLDADCQPLGTIAEMIVDTETEFVDWVVLDTGAEYAVHSIQIRDGRVVLEPLPWADPEAAPAEPSAPAAAEPTAAPMNEVSPPIESPLPAPQPADFEWTRQRVALGPSTADAPPTSPASHVLQLRQEELRAVTRPVEVGEVRVHKQVVSEPRTIEVPLSHEAVVIDHRPVPHRPADPIGSGETLSLIVRAEQPAIERVPRVAEQVTIGKRTVETAQPVTATVRHDELVVEPRGEVVVRTESTG